MRRERPPLLYADTQDPVSQLAQGVYVFDPHQPLDAVAEVSVLLSAELDAVDPEGTYLRVALVRQARAERN